METNLKHREVTKRTSQCDAPVSSRFPKQRILEVIEKDEMARRCYQEKYSAVPSPTFLGIFLKVMSKMLSMYKMIFYGILQDIKINHLRQGFPLNYLILKKINSYSVVFYREKEYRI